MSANNRKVPDLDKSFLLPSDTNPQCAPWASAPTPADPDFDFIGMAGLEQPPLQTREFQVATAIKNSSANHSTWPPYPRRTDVQYPLFRRVIDESERTDDTIHYKNARLIGMLATLIEADYSGNRTIQDWGLAPHLAMIGALSVTMSAGISPSAESLRFASEVHFYNTVANRTSLSTDRYAIPNPESTITGMRQLSRTYTSGIFRSGGGQHLIDCYNMYLNKELETVQPSQQLLEAWTLDPELNTSARFVTSLLLTIEQSRTAVAEFVPELDSEVTRYYGQLMLHRREMHENRNRPSFRAFLLDYSERDLAA